jgi:hypothetical protein
MRRRGHFDFGSDEWFGVSLCGVGECIDVFVGLCHRVKGRCRAGSFDPDSGLGLSQEARVGIVQLHAGMAPESSFS